MTKTKTKPRRKTTGSNDLTNPSVAKAKIPALPSAIKPSLTVPKVFIIESLSFENEEAELFEGHIISDILRLSGIESKYYYVRTKNELIYVLDIFNASRYRYLHISCHGGKNKDSIWMTLEEIGFAALGEILEFHLDRKRLFLSACSVVNNKLAEELIPKSDCISIIGPKNDIAFRDATIMWSSFYHLMFKDDSRKMLGKNVVENMQKVVNTFGEPLNYFRSSKSKIIKSSVIIPK